MKILFLLKKHQTSGSNTELVMKSGLFNSARMISEQLLKHLNVETKLSICIDGNSIDREVFNYKPDIVILEAIWVTPEKLIEIQKLHENVKFIVRVHSEIPFLSNEGNAIGWIKEFIKIPNVYVGLNSLNTFKNFNLTMTSDKFLYLPNIYSDIECQGVLKTCKDFIGKLFNRKKVYQNEINIGCFGAIRPMKNQLIQAFAAIDYADKHDVVLNFHVNGSRLEQGGNSTLKNLKALFENTSHKLIEHEWMSHDDFLNLISTMDIGLQISMNETFNIVTADFVHQNVPIVVSETIDWMPKKAFAPIDKVMDIEKKITEVLKNKKMFNTLNKIYLTAYNKKSIKTWKYFIGI